MIVLDANVAVKAYVEEAGSEAATDLLAGTDRLLAPELIRVEVAGALCRQVRLGQLEAMDAESLCGDWLGDLTRGLFALTPDRDLVPEAMALATKLMHPLADCMYLALAIRANAPLLTADRTFHKRVRPLYKQITMLAGCDTN
jgi:predicted nucleic acid-binding protein